MARTPFRRPGQLRDRIRIERRERIDSSAGDGAGNWQEGWTVLIDSAFASIESTRGREQVIAGRLEGVSVFDIWLRRDTASAKIRTGDRAVDVRDPSRIFNIRWIDSLDQRNRFLLMQCEQGVADG